jgi:polyhydroxyalkanoate synthesis regulator phasin
MVRERSNLQVRALSEIPEVEMIDLIKKALYTGLGLAMLTKERAEEVVKDLTQQAELSEQEGRELLAGLLQQSESARRELEARLDEAISSTVRRLNLATKDEVAGLREKVEALAAKLGQNSGQ